MAVASVEIGKGNRICLSGGVLSADLETVEVEAENVCLSFIARPLLSFVVYVALLMRKPMGSSDGCSLRQDCPLAPDISDCRFQPENVPRITREQHHLPRVCYFS